MLSVCVLYLFAVVTINVIKSVTANPYSLPNPYLLALSMQKSISNWLIHRQALMWEWKNVKLWCGHRSHPNCALHGALNFALGERCWNSRFCISLLAFSSLARETENELTRFLACWLVRPLASYPGREGEGKKRPGIYCTRMRQHFRNICRKIVRITLSKHMVMPRKRNADEISGKREGKDLPSQNKSCFQAVPSLKHLK